MRSARWYLAQMQDLRRQAELGLRSTADALRLHQMTGAELEAFMNVKLLEMQNEGAAIDVAPDPEEDYQAPRIGAHRVKRVTVKRSQDKLGRLVDEKTVAITSSSPGDDPEIAAEIEAIVWARLKRGAG
jgi:hypothetical protein